jgi:lipoate-protein ligase B
VITTLATLGIESRADPGAIGVWTEVDGTAAKICAIGVRIRRGVSLHGLALNLDTNLNLFKLIVPCGLADRPVTSIRNLLGDAAPTMEQLKSTLFEQLRRAIERQ